MKSDYEYYEEYGEIDENASIIDSWVMRQEEYKDVLLTTCLVVSYQSGGKTELVNSLIYDINHKNSKYVAVNLMSKHFGEIFKLHEKQYAAILEEVRKADILNIFLDDALHSLHSTLKKKKTDVDYAEIRHYFQALLSGTDPENPPMFYCGEKGLTLNVFFATQRYQLLSPMERETHIFIAKAIDFNVMDENGNYFMSFLGRDAVTWLKENAHSVHIDKKKKSMNQYIAKVIGRQSELISFIRRPRVPFLVLYETQTKKINKKEAQILADAYMKKELEYNNDNGKKKAKSQI